VFAESCPSIQFAGELRREQGFALNLDSEPSMQVTASNPQSSRKTFAEMAQSETDRLKEVLLRYRRKGEVKWMDAKRIIADVDEPQNVDFAANDTVGKENYGYRTMQWDWRDAVPIADGTYEIRIDSICEEIDGANPSFNTFSTSSVTGLIDRVKPAQYGLPTPIDELWPGEEITFYFTEQVQCRWPFNFKLVVTVDGIVDSNGNVQEFTEAMVNDLLVQCQDNHISFTFDQSYIPALSGQTIQATLTDVRDLAGNVLDPFTPAEYQIDHVDVDVGSAPVVFEVELEQNCTVGLADNGAGALVAEITQALNLGQKMNVNVQSVICNAQTNHLKATVTIFPPPKYQLLKLNDAGCPPELHITSEEQCTEAALEFGGRVANGAIQVGSSDQVPCGCSIEAGTTIHFDANFNSCSDSAITHAPVCLIERRYVTLPPTATPSNAPTTNTTALPTASPATSNPTSTPTSSTTASPTANPTNASRRGLDAATLDDGNGELHPHGMYHKLRRLVMEKRNSTKITKLHNFQMLGLGKPERRTLDISRVLSSSVASVSSMALQHHMFLSHEGFASGGTGPMSGATNLFANMTASNEMVSQLKMLESRLKKDLASSQEELKKELHLHRSSQDELKKDLKEEFKAALEYQMQSLMMMACAFIGGMMVLMAFILVCVFARNGRGGIPANPIRDYDYDDNDRQALVDESQLATVSQQFGVPAEEENGKRFSGIERGN